MGRAELETGSKMKLNSLLHGSQTIVFLRVYEHENEQLNVIIMIIIIWNNILALLNQKRFVSVCVCVRYYFIYSM